MNLSDFTVSDLVAGAALLVALWSVVQTSRFNKRQNAFAETAERLNRILIERESAESKQQLQADVSASFVKIGKSSHRFKVFNRGATASNVRLEFLVGEDLVPEGELNEKFPIPALERHQNVDIMTRVHFQSTRRAHIRLHWDDATGSNHQKELWLDVF